MSYQVSVENVWDSTCTVSVKSDSLFVEILSVSIEDWKHFSDSDYILHQTGDLDVYSCNGLVSIKIFIGGNDAVGSISVVFPQTLLFDALKEIE